MPKTTFFKKPLNDKKRPNQVQSKNLTYDFRISAHAFYINGVEYKYSYFAEDVGQFLKRLLPLAFFALAKAERNPLTTDYYQHSNSTYQFDFNEKLSSLQFSRLEVIAYIQTVCNGTFLEQASSKLFFLLKNITGEKFIPANTRGAGYFVPEIAERFWRAINETAQEPFEKCVEAIMDLAMKEPESKGSTIPFLVFLSLLGCCCITYATVSARQTIQRQISNSWLTVKEGVATLAKITQEQLPNRNSFENITYEHVLLSGLTILYGLGNIAWPFFLAEIAAAPEGGNHPTIEYFEGRPVAAAIAFGLFWGSTQLVYYVRDYFTKKISKKDYKIKCQKVLEKLYKISYTKKEKFTNIDSFLTRLDEVSLKDLEAKVNSFPALFEILSTTLILANFYEPEYYALLAFLFTPIIFPIADNLNLWLKRIVSPNSTAAHIEEIKEEFDMSLKDAVKNYEGVKTYTSLGKTIVADVNGYLKEIIELEAADNRNGSVAFMMFYFFIAVLLSIILARLSSIANDEDDNAYHEDDLFFISSYLLSVAGSVFTLMNNTRDYWSTREKTIKYNQFLQLKEEKPSNDVEPDLSKGIEFKDVEYIVEPSDENNSPNEEKIGYKLRNLNFTLEPGTVTALVGESGAGKSTIVKLLFGFNKGNKKNIFLIDKNGTKTSLQNVNINSFRKKISYVQQETILFKSKKFGANILETVEKPEENKEELRKYASTLFFNSPPTDQDYNDLLKKDAKKLSGGEEQRVGAIRGLLKEGADIYIFDEITSKLDNGTELKLMNLIYELARKGKIVLVIAHRLTTVVNADQIIFLSASTEKKEGVKYKIGEQYPIRGNHLFMLERCKPYKQLWKDFLAPFLEKNSSLMEETIKMLKNHPSGEHNNVLSATEDQEHASQKMEV